LIAKRKKNKNSISQGLYKSRRIAMILYSIVPPEIYLETLTGVKTRSKIILRWIIAERK